MKATTIAQLERLSGAFDRLIGDVRAAPSTSVREAERRIGEGERIAAGIRAVFRGEGK